MTYLIPEKLSNDFDVNKIKTDTPGKNKKLILLKVQHQQTKIK